MKYFEARKHKKLKSKLFKILDGYMNWFNEVNDSENLKAKEKLVEFYTELKACKPSSYYELGMSHVGAMHTSYLRYLLNIKVALEQKLYLRACNEIGSLIAYSEPIFQSRIYYNLIDLLENSLNINSDSI